MSRTRRSSRGTRRFSRRWGFRIRRWSGRCWRRSRGRGRARPGGVRRAGARLAYYRQAAEAGGAVYRAGVQADARAARLSAGARVSGVRGLRRRARFHARVRRGRLGDLQGERDRHRRRVLLRRRKDRSWRARPSAVSTSALASQSTSSLRPAGCRCSPAGTRTSTSRCSRPPSSPYSSTMMTTSTSSPTAAVPRRRSPRPGSWAGRS